MTKHFILWQGISSSNSRYVITDITDEQRRVIVNLFGAATSRGELKLGLVEPIEGVKEATIDKLAEVAPEWFAHAARLGD